ncbi:2Fe-2S iron-sulfur cluster-binding protein [Clostridium botulinum]|nr:xanthine dehydrogenase, iron-sulfur binding subunit [Clostridium botulinum CFSAN002367]MCS4526468.1 2Fe-2S iron-sulfur cluster-binding protein [Clostridium botulinum]
MWILYTGFSFNYNSFSRKRKNYTDDEIKREISGHLCRCTGYNKIFNATKKAILKRK